MGGRLGRARRRASGRSGCRSSDHRAMLPRIGASARRPSGGRYHRPHARSVAPGSPRRPPRHRLLDGPRRAVLHDAPRRPRRRRRQGRAARGRRDARLGTAVGRQRDGRHADRRLLPRGQPQQAQRSGSTSASPRARRSCAACWPTPTSSSRTSGRAASPGSASMTTMLAALNPRLVHLAITGYGTERPGSRPARLRLRHPGDERADVHHRRGRRRRRRPDQGRRRDQRRRDRDARGGERAGGAPGAGAGPRRGASDLAGDAGAAGRPADRHLAARRRRWPPSSTRPRTRSSTGVAPGRPRQRPPEHRPVRDLRHRRRRRSRSRSAPSGSGRGSARPSGCRRSPTTRASRPTAIASSIGPSFARCSRRGSWNGDGRRGSRALEAAEIPAGRSATSLEAFAVARGGGARHDRRAGASRPGASSARSASRSSCRRTPASIRTPPPLARRRTPTRSSRELGYDADADRGAAPRRASSEPGLQLLAAERPARRPPSGQRDQAPRSTTTGSRTSPVATGRARSRGRCAGPAEPAGRVGRHGRDRRRRSTGPSSATKPIPAAAAVEPVTRAAEERDRRPGPEAAARPAPPATTQPPTGGGSNRIAV